MTAISSAVEQRPGILRAGAALTYAGLCYLAFLAVFLAFVGFVAGVLPGRPAADADFWQAALIDVGLIVGFALQHSIMARKGFKRRWTQIVPQPVERATYVLAASLALAAMIAFWRPLPGVVWELHGIGAAALWTLFALGWATVLATTVMIDHFELFGLRQAWVYASGRSLALSALKTPSLYRLVRHPMQLGFVVAFWAAPMMTLDRLALATLLTLYIVAALVLEERDLVAEFGDEYRRYQARTPRLLPMIWRRRD